MKAIKVMNSNDEVIAIVDNATKALMVVEKDSQCSLADYVKLQSVNKRLQEGGDVITNCQGGVYTLQVIEGNSAFIRREKQYYNAMQTVKLFN
jgi:glutathione peroxidase-family protein